MILKFNECELKTVFEVTEDKKLLLLHFSTDEFEEKNIEEKELFTPFEISVSGRKNGQHGAKHIGSSGSGSLKYKNHKYYENEFGTKLEFLLEDDELSVVLHYQFYKGISGVRSWCGIKNISGKNVGLEYVSSFSLNGIDKEGNRNPNEKMRVYIPHNSWCREIDWKKYTLSELGYDKIESRHSFKRIMLSNTGSWSTKEYLPMGAFENSESNNVLMWQIENNGSWTWEISDIGNSMYLKLSGPSENENHWHKELKPGQMFESVKTAVTVGEDFTDALSELTSYRRRIVRKNKADSFLPVIFNDYMNCLWADPTTEKMIPIIDKAADIGSEYYCMDAGWYADGAWWETVGEWIPCEWRFKNGIKEVFDYIKAKGMIPGIWLEIEVMGIECPLAKKFPDERFFMRHGKRVIVNGRYLLDFRNEDVRAFATSVIDRVVSEYGVGYIKMDYNVDAGTGTEINSDSFGDGLLEHNRAYLLWIGKMMDRYPDLVIENCSSGGMRMEYASLALNSVQSVTDQESFKNMPAISAALATAVLPEQGAMWTYPTSKENDNETALNMVNALLCRMHMSGEIANLSDSQMDLVKEGIECYKNIRKDIKDFKAFYPDGIETYGKNWLSVGYEAKNGKYLAVWRLNSEDNCHFVSLESNFERVDIVYPKSGNCTVKILDGGLDVKFSEKYSAAVLKIL